MLYKRQTSVPILVQSGLFNCPFTPRAPFFGHFNRGFYWLNVGFMSLTFFLFERPELCRRNIMVGDE